MGGKFARNAGSMAVTREQRNEKIINALEETTAKALASKKQAREAPIAERNGETPSRVWRSPGNEIAQGLESFSHFLRA